MPFLARRHKTPFPHRAPTNCVYIQLSAKKGLCWRPRESLSSRGAHFWHTIECLRATKYVVTLRGAGSPDLNEQTSENVIMECFTLGVVPREIYPFIFAPRLRFVCGN